MGYYVQRKLVGMQSSNTVLRNEKIITFLPRVNDKATTNVREIEKMMHTKYYILVHKRMLVLYIHTYISIREIFRVTLPQTRDF